MKYLVTLLLASVMAFCSAPAVADTGTALNWTAPETRVDGTAFSVDEIDRYELCANTTDTAGCDGPQTISADVDRIALTEIVDDYQSRYFSIRVVDTSGLASGWSDAVLGKLLAPPNAPYLTLTQ